MLSAYRPLLLLFTCVACASTQPVPKEAPAGPAAIAALDSRSGSSVAGTARFESTPNGLAIHVTVEGATPGSHGIHIHENGDCSAPDAASAGAHYDPHKAGHHGGPTSPVHHAGDLGNIEVDQNGKGTLDVTVQGLSVDGPSDGVVGKSLVVHEKTDDLTTDPTGNSGARVACGTIQAAPPR